MQSKTITKGLPWKQALIAGFVISLVAIMLNLIYINTTASTYNDNTSLLTKLNVSNKAPAVYGVILHDNNSQTNMILEQGTYHTIICNATVNDTNGYGDITTVNATIYKYPEYGPNSSQDNNYKYSNASCRQYATSGVITAYYTCKFNVWYYAYNGTWRCNVTAIDNSSATNSSYDDSIIDPLFAINLSTTEIDFGELEPGQSSSDQEVNVTNFGNMNLTIAVKGYGVTEGDGWAMNCTVGNISIGYERYALDPGIAWDSMTQLTSSFTNIAGLTVYQRVDDNDNAMINSTNSTYWKIKAPFGTKGQCNGTLVFSA
ncbi:hypothetical protein DRJ48_05295, partial [Candidatus Woesearchaeota archaeon]